MLGVSSDKATVLTVNVMLFSCKVKIIRVLKFSVTEV